MGQGASSIDYNYIYENKKNSNNNNNLQKDKNVIKLKNQEKISKLNSEFNELLNVLKYHTNMFIIDKTFVLKNKLMSKELDEKITHLKKQVKKNNDEYNTLNESLRIDNTETKKYDIYIVTLKYIDLFLFILIVLLVAINFLKTRSNLLNI